MRVACSEGETSRSGSLIARRSENSAQVNEAFDHSLGCLEHLSKLGLPHSRAFRSPQVISEQQPMQWFLGHPRTCFLEGHFALHPVFRACGDLPRKYAADCLRVLFFSAIIDDRK